VLVADLATGQRFFGLRQLLELTGDLDVLCRRAPESPVFSRSQGTIPSAPSAL